MAGPLDPFTPGLDTTPNAGLDPGTFDKLRGEWGAFLSDPRGQAAVMSMGLALTQPPSFGDNALSQIGRAVGAAGESGRLLEAQDLKRSELESKDAMREAQAQARLMTAGAAEQRAEAASARAGAAGDRAGFQAERLRMQQESLGLRERLGASIRYQSYKNEVAKRNQNNAFMNPGAPPEPVMSYPDFLKTMGFNVPGVQPTDSGDELSVPPAADTTSRPAGAPAIGEVRKGYRFKGGNPADQKNWEKI